MSSYGVERPDLMNAVVQGGIQMVWPPETSIFCALIQRLSSENRDAIIGPISSGRSGRSSAVAAAICLAISGLSLTAPPEKSVWIAPRATTDGDAPRLRFLGHIMCHDLACALHGGVGNPAARSFCSFRLCQRRFRCFIQATGSFLLVCVFFVDWLLDIIGPASGSRM